MIKIGLLGYGGRMGQAIAAEIAANEACKLVGGVVREMKPHYEKAEGILITPNVDEVIGISDVVIDFTLASVVPDNARRAVAHKKPFMSGATGLAADAVEALKKAGEHIPVLYAPNTSLSLAAVRPLVALATKLLGGFDYDISIHDEHHRMKKDAPSGTALALGQAVAEGSGGKKKPQYSSMRAGHIVGEHEVIFAGEGEVVRIRHSVTDRRIFARGAVQAALWLHDKAVGFYGMDDVLGL